MKKVGFLYDDIFLLHEMPPGHPESIHRLSAITESLKKTESWNALIHLKPKKAEKQDILRAHTNAYYEKILQFTGYYDADTYVSENSFEAALFAAGAVIDAVNNCRTGKLDRAFCAIRPPGHHAESNRAMGFCIFNNVAIGTRYAQSIGYKKVFIIDFDVHHGNGTQHIFEKEDTVFYFSTHQYPHYPGTGNKSEKGRGKGTGFTYNIPMNYGSGDKEYYAAFHGILHGLTMQFVPDIILVSAGYDLHAKDPLAGIRVSSQGIRNIVQGILLSSKKIPYIFCLEGGYNLDVLSESVKITIEELFNCD
jgi:acetoin utilization deacetylase AcuC-like enzyme